VPPARPSGSLPAPHAFERTQAEYEKARRDYEMGAFSQAADGFIRAAGMLAVMRTKPYDEVAAANRAIFYEDAAYAWVMAGTRDAGLERLESLRDRGVASDDELKRALEVLHTRR
jgi:hypothetical protein